MIGVVAVVALLGFGLAANNESSIAVGEPAPDAPVERLGAAGTAELADYRGEWVLVNFWASWCEPCKVEAPDIETWKQRHDGEVTVIGINTQDSTDDALAFVDEYELTWEMLRDGDGDRRDAFGVYLLPGTFLIDPEGKIAGVLEGLVTRERLEQQFTPLIEADPA